MSDLVINFNVWNFTGKVCSFDTKIFPLMYFHECTYVLYIATYVAIQYFMYMKPY